MRRWFVAVALFMCCRYIDVSLENRPCEEGRCAPGYVCHPELSVCTKEVLVDCDAGACPSALQTGDECDTPRSFIPCADDGPLDCSEGCRTCTGDRTWSQCSIEAPPAFSPRPASSAGASGPVPSSGSGTGIDPPDDPTGSTGATSSTGSSGSTGVTSATGATGSPTCTLGTRNNCGACGDNCRRREHVDDAECQAFECVIERCDRDWHDLDRDPKNGCEYRCHQREHEDCDGDDDDCDGVIDNGCCTPSGPESCDGVDNDCDGQVDQAGAAGCSFMFADQDHDGFGSILDFGCVCPGDATYSVSNGADCDDDDAQCTIDCSAPACF